MSRIFMFRIFSVPLDILFFIILANVCLMISIMLLIDATTAFFYALYLVVANNGLHAGRVNNGRVT